MDRHGRGIDPDRADVRRGWCTEESDIPPGAPKLERGLINAER
jgi:hypothetical protein